MSIIIDEMAKTLSEEDRNRILDAFSLDYTDRVPNDNFNFDEDESEDNPANIDNPLTREEFAVQQLGVYLRRCVQTRMKEYEVHMAKKNFRALDIDESNLF